MTNEENVEDELLLEIQGRLQDYAGFLLSDIYKDFIIFSDEYTQSLYKDLAIASDPMSIYRIQGQIAAADTFKSFFNLTTQTLKDQE